MTDSVLVTVGFGLLGLLVGSFLNVVIYRLPVMLQRSWQSESIEYLRSAGVTVPPPEGEESAKATAFNLMVPRSRCGHCGHAIASWQNIPVLSYLLLGGKCGNCKTRISIRYPLVELATGVCFAFCGYKWGLTPDGLMSTPTLIQALAWSGFAAAVICLIMIDWDTTLLPDSITLPLLWAGMLASLLGITNTSLNASVWGAIAGYLSLWSVYWLFKLLTKKEGMGYGDFKLLAALGAWMGVSAILPIAMASAIIGAIIGILLKFKNSLREGGYIPYGPFLGGAGLAIAAIGTGPFYQWLYGI